MEFAQQILQSTADFTISSQNYLWSFLGVKPYEGIIPRQTKLVENRQTPTVFLFGDRTVTIPMSMGALARRVAGISGAVAVAMAAYGAHRVLMDSAIDDRRKKAMENANKHHFIHTLGILFSTKARYPLLTITFFAFGILIFCGSCYAYGIWNNDRIRTISPLGGLMFILGWLSFVL